MELLRSTKPYLWHMDYVNKEGINYEQTFSLVARYTSIRTIMALIAYTK